MGIVFRQSIKSTIVIAAGALLGALINYAYPFILSKPEFGYTRIFIVQAAIFHIFLMLGIGSTIMNFSARYEHGSPKRKILITISAIAPVIIVTLLSVPYFIFKPEILQFFKPEDRGLAGRYYPLVPVLVFLWSYMVALECYLITQSKAAIISFVREIVLRILNLALIGLLFANLISFGQLIYGLTVSYLISVLLLFIIARRTGDFGFSLDRNAFRRDEYKEIANYSWYHMFVTITLNLLGFVDTMLLGSLSPDGLSSVAVYNEAVFIVTLLYIPYRAMSNASIPTLNRIYLSGKFDELKDVFHRSGINILIASLAMFVLIVCNLDNAVAILPKDYSEIKPVVLILLIGRIIDMSTGLNTELTSVSKYYKFNFRISVVLLIMLVAFCYWLIPEYGIYGAAWGTTFALAFFNIAKMCFLWAKMGIQPFSRQSLVVLLCAGAAFLAGYWLPYLVNPVVDTIIRSLAIALVYGGLLIWLKPSKDLNTYLASIKKNKRLF